MAESALIDDLLRQYGENPRRVFARLANEYRKQGDLTTAIEICRTQVPLQPTYISGYIVLGQALFESGQLDEARATFEAAIGLDPENLIGLRQLGDIARLGGDIDGARSWYYRLLEVDPQNEDVAAMVRALEAAPEAQPVAPEGGEQVSWSDINPERAVPPVPVTPPMPRLTLGMIPEDLSAEPARAPENEPIEMSGPEGAGAAGTRAVPPPPPPLPAAPPAKPAPTLEITGLEDFAQFSAPIAPPPAPSRPAASAPSELPPLEATTGEFHAPPAPPSPPKPEFGAPAAHPEEEEPALWSPPTTAEHAAMSPPAADALRDTLAFPTPRDVPAMDAASRPPAPAVPPRPAVDNFGSVAGAAPAPAPAMPSQEEAYDPTVGRMLDLNATSGQDAPPEFLTETMAELYLQQGYHQEALQIYRQLSEQRPGDQSLKERIARLEHGARSSLSVAASISEDVINAAQARAARPAQTSRSFFGGLASRRAPATPPSGMSAEPAAPVAPAAPAPPEPHAPPLAGATPAELNGLFSERVPEPDEAAAAALAGAFSEEYSGGGTPTPASAQPSRAASQPLSLDEVFRGQRPTTEAQRSSPSVTFDEFFSPRESGSVQAVTPTSPAQPAAGSAPPEADLALFHEWLDGLKK